MLANTAVIKIFEVNWFQSLLLYCCQVEHIIVKPELETAFIRLFPGAVIKGQTVGVAFVFCYVLCIY